MPHKQLFFLILVLISSSAWAGMLYKWRDSDGKLHYTDNPANIPLQQEQIEKRTIENPVAPDSGIVKARSDNGRALWKDKCASCHFISVNPTGEYRRQISASLLNEDATVESVAPQLSQVVKQRAGDMNNVTITEGEAQAIAAYLLQRANP